MNAVPARVAGVQEVILCTPPQQDGTIPPSVLIAAREAGVSRVFKVGGAQAIAAMAYGTETIPAVEKIVGPGNLYVALAKRTLWGVVGVDLWAGPSEVAIIADESANPAYVAADLLTQLEHGAESVGYLFTPSRAMLQQTLIALEQQLSQRTRRATLEQSLSHSLAVLTRSLPEAFELANAAAPEHLTLMVQNPMHWLGSVRSAGCILLGETPQAAGDYVAGPSHTLPTGRAARFESPVSVETFIKRSSVIALSRDALRTLAPDILALAHEEGFEAHAAAVQIRITEE
jgi:histidinol dehydrogenase